MKFEFDELIAALNNSISLPTKKVFNLKRLSDTNYDERVVQTARFEYFGGTFMIQQTVEGV